MVDQSPTLVKEMEKVQHPKTKTQYSVSSQYSLSKKRGICRRDDRIIKLECDEERNGNLFLLEHLEMKNVAPEIYIY